MALVKNRTDPSHMLTITPFVWALLAVVLIRPGGNMHERVFGPPTWKYAVVEWYPCNHGAPTSDTRWKLKLVGSMELHWLTASSGVFG